MVSGSHSFAKHLATLSKAVDSVSANLSIALVLGLALVPLVPEHAASTLSERQAAGHSSAAAAPVTGSVEVVRTKPVPEAALQTPAAKATAPAAEAKTPAGAAAPPAKVLQVVAQRSLDRKRAAQQTQPESGDLGKAAPPAQAAKAPAGDPKKTPVAAADPKAQAKAEPAEPDEWSEEEIIGALRECLRRLAPLGAEIEVGVPVKQERCGAPAPVVLKRIGSSAGRVDFQPPPMLNCAMVASLHAWIEKTLQPAAQEHLGSRVVRVRNASGYACRNRLGTLFHSDRLSEHALANAIDISGFVTADGRTIDVARNWGPTARDIRRREIELAEAKAAAATKERERLEGELKLEREKLEKDKAGLPPATKDAAARKERQKAQAELKQREKNLRQREGELRAAENAEEREVERRKALERAPVKSAQLQKPGRATDAGSRAIPIAGTSDSMRRPPEASFLRRLHEGACGTFGTVLGPEANEAHRDHFHLDLAPRRRSAFCE